MARTRSENYDDIQRGILSAACGLFARQGYMRASIAELAEACKLSRGALYHYFDSKEAILFAILDEHVRQMIADVEGRHRQAHLDARPVPRGDPRHRRSQCAFAAGAAPDSQRSDLPRRGRSADDQVARAADRRSDCRPRSPARQQRQDRQANQESLHDDAVRHAQLQPHLVRSQGGNWAGRICRHGRGSVPARHRKPCGVKTPCDQRVRTDLNVNSRAVSGFPRTADAARV